MAQKPDLYSPHRPVPAKPITQSFPTPVLTDRILVVRKDSRLGGYKLPDKGSAFAGPDAPRFRDFKFATAKPSDQTGWVDWFYVNERLNQDDYNFVVEYPWVDQTYPRVTRTYVILREDRVDPDAAATDPKNDTLSLVDSKITRLDDPVLDALFVGVQNVFERVPAPVAFGSNKFDSVLPYKFRVAVPEITITTIKEGAAQPTSLIKGQWGGSEETNSFNRRTVKLTTRNLPPGGVTFIGEKLTRDRQVAIVTDSWKDEQQHITARPTLLEADVEQVGDGTTLKSETEVDEVFPETRHAAEIPDAVPQKFRSITPTRTLAKTTAGQVQPPDLGVGELSVVEDQQTTQTMRRSVVKRDPEDLPATLKDYELGGIRTHGSEFGGTLETAETLDKKPQQVEEGFDIIASSVKNVGSGLTLKAVTRLFTGGNGTGPYLELLDGGDSYVDNPAIVFDTNRGSGAAGVATISEIPITPGGLDAGGDFPLAHVTNGDANGLLTFLGERYNQGAWANPTVANGSVKVSAMSASLIPDFVLQRAADHDLTTSVTINPRPGGSNSMLFDLGPGKSFTPDYVTLRGPGADVPPTAASATKFEVWAFNTFGENTDKVRVGGPFTIPAAGTWGGFALSAVKGYRYLSINATALVPLDYTNTIYPRFNFAEVEFYGGLVILPAVDLGFAFNGDDAGVFNYLGQRGGGGTWRNPQTNGNIEVTAPYDVLDFGTFDSMVDREPSNTYLVDRLGSEIWFDLKDDRGLLLRTLLYRQRADYNSPTTLFYVQGSMDGSTWEERQRCDVSHIASAWTKITITEFTKFYRYFRIILPSDKSALAIGEIELYGELTLDPAEVGGGAGTFSVTGVNVTNPGADYADPPNVIFSGGGGIGAVGTAVLNDEGGVDHVIMNSTGGGYTTVPDVYFIISGTGTGATASSNISGGVVTSIDVDDPGSRYDPSDPPKVKIVSATGSGAVAIANVALDGTIDSITVVSGGTGYARRPTVVLYPTTDPEADAVVGYPLEEITLIDRGEDYTSPPATHFTGSGSVATANVTLGFGIATAHLTSGGDGYTSAPTVVISGDGSGATGTAVIGKVVASTTVTAGGSGYLTEPEVSVSGDGGAQFRAVIGRPILTIGLTNRGNAYTSDPTVAITGDGSGATAHVVRSFTIASIAISAGGTGYTTTVPTVILSAPTGEFPVQATAHAVLTGTAVSGIVIDNAGAGYKTAPTATLSGGDGTGATAGAVTLSTGGAIDSIIVDTHGTGYTAATVALTGGGGSGATATIGLDTLTAGAIKKVEIVNPGIDYAAAPTLTIVPGTSGGTGATATAALSSAGRVTEVSITNPGELYTSASIGFSGGGGSGAAATAVLLAAGKIKSVDLLTQGNGFGDDTEISFTGGGGSGALATVSPSGCGEVVTATLTKPGGPFLVPPVVRFVGGQSFLCDSGNAGWTALPNLLQARMLHTATLLPDGRVFVAGGQSGAAVSTALTSCEIFDPATDTWSAAASMTHARTAHAAVLLPDGRVFVMGGQNTSITNPENTSEIYDPGTDTWVDSGSMVSPNDNLSGNSTQAVVLDDGRVFAIRGRREAKSTQIFDLGTETWSLTSPWPYSDADFSASLSELSLRLLPDNTVLVAFGRHTVVSGSIYRGTAGIFDPVTETWSEPAGDIPLHWSVHTATILDDGKIHYSAGFTDDPTSAPAIPYVFDPDTGLFTATGAADALKHYGREASLLANGDVLVTGGAILGGSGYSDTAEIWHSSTGISVSIDNMLGGRRWHSQVTLQDGRALVIGGQNPAILATVESYGSILTPATAVYHLGSSWPTLIEEQTDPTEGIVTRITKKIVPVGTPLPAGFAESFPLDIYRSIQIVSNVDLHSLPPPEIYKTTQHVAFPQQLIAVYPIWDSSKHQSTAGGDGTGTNRGSVSATISVHGAIVVKTLSGFRGAAMGRIERQFFGSLAEAETATDGVVPTIIRPSSGTAILRGASNSTALEGLTFDQSPPLNAAGQPAQPGDTMPDGSIFGGSFQLPTRATSSGASGTSTAQIKEINDVLTGGLNIDSSFIATNSSSAGVLTASATAKGTFVVSVPASTPSIIVPGQAILSQVVLERWRLGLFVRHLIYLESPV